MNCTICGEPVELVPSAEERARKTGESPGFFRRLFTTHADCFLQKRAADTVELMRRLTADAAARRVAWPLR